MADEARNLRRDRRKSNEVGDFNSGAGCEASRLGWRCRRKTDCLESGESGRGLPQSKIVSSRVMCLSAKAQVIGTIAAQTASDWQREWKLPVVNRWPFLPMD